MKRLLLITLLFIQFPILSQINLSPSDFANGGDTIRMSQSDDGSLDFAASGSNYIWDFSALVPSSQSLKDFKSMVGSPSFLQLVYGTFAPLKYQASYYIESTALPVDQMAAIMGVPIEEVFQFTRISNDSITSIGYSMQVDGNNLPLKSDTIEKRYDFPIQYGNTHFSRGYTKVDFNPMMDAIWIQHRTRNTTVDGYGTITTPYGTFDAMRIKHDITELDSIYYVFPFVGGMWVPLIIPLSHEYEWWTNGEKEPILKIITNEIGGNEVISSTEYRDIYRGMDAGLSENKLEFTIYPNPASDKIHVDAFVELDAIYITDSNGKQINFIKKIEGNSNDIDISGLNSGCYFVHVISNGISSSRIFIKK